MTKAMKKSSKAMHFETKGFEVKAGKTIITRRPYAKVTVSEDMIYLGAAMSVGVPLAVAGAKQVGKLCKKAGKAIGGVVNNVTSKKQLAAEAEEDFMEQ